MSEQAPEPPPQAGTIADPDKWAADRSRETTVLLQLRKRNLLRALAQAQSAEDTEEAAAAIDVQTGELIAIDRLETKLASRQRVNRAREMTRAFRGAARS